ncbi:hypothetical protein BLNAU_1335 [Blattamonas nauphoetae]|uniref:Uncharacterized protein n=1 Tax=Blattamonas nauphoetae TaxID=2049346 RepID=A0ABQ9YJ38_9EUKA|nr:hypothetical protein BLNAU_1335 [Blattamonas nauphoetae]
MKFALSKKPSARPIAQSFQPNPHTATTSSKRHIHTRTETPSQLSEVSIKKSSRSLSTVASHCGRIFASSVLINFSSFYSKLHEFPQSSAIVGRDRHEERLLPYGLALSVVPEPKEVECDTAQRTDSFQHDFFQPKLSSIQSKLQTITRYTSPHQGTLAEPPKHKKSHSKGHPPTSARKSRSENTTTQTRYNLVVRIPLQPQPNMSLLNRLKCEGKYYPRSTYPTASLSQNAPVRQVVSYSSTLLNLFSHILPLIPRVYSAELQASATPSERLCSMEALLATLLPSSQLGSSLINQNTLYSMKNGINTDVRAIAVEAFCQNDFVTLDHILTILYPSQRCFENDSFSFDDALQTNTATALSINKGISHMLWISHILQSSLVHQENLVSSIQPTLTIPRRETLPLTLAEPPNLRFYQQTYKHSLPRPKVDSEEQDKDLSVTKMLEERIPFGNITHVSESDLLDSLISYNSSPLISTLYSQPNPISYSLIPFHLSPTEIKPLSPSLFTPIFHFSNVTSFETLHPLRALISVFSNRPVLSDRTDDWSDSFDTLRQIPSPPPDSNDFSVSLAQREWRIKMRRFHVLLNQMSGSTPLTSEEEKEMEDLCDAIQNSPKMSRKVIDGRVLERPTTLPLIFLVFELIYNTLPEHEHSTQLIHCFLDSPHLFLQPDDERSQQTLFRILRHHALQINSKMRADSPVIYFSHSSSSSFSTDYPSSSRLSPSLTLNPFFDATASVDFLPSKAAHLTLSKSKKIKPVHSVKSPRSQIMVTDPIFDHIANLLSTILSDPSVLTHQTTSALVPPLSLLNQYLKSCSTSTSTHLALSVLFTPLLTLRHSLALTIESSCQVSTLQMNTRLSSHPFVQFPELWEVASLTLQIQIHLSSFLNDAASTLTLFVLMFGSPTSLRPEDDSFFIAVCSFCCDSVFLQDPQRFVHTLPFSSPGRQPLSIPCDFPRDALSSFSVDSLSLVPPFLFFSYLHSVVKVLTLLSQWTPVTQTNSAASFILSPFSHSARSTLQSQQSQPCLQTVQPIPTIQWPYSVIDWVLNPVSGFMFNSISGTLLPEERETTIFRHILPHKFLLPYGAWGYLDHRLSIHLLRTLLEVLSIPNNPFLSHPDYVSTYPVFAAIRLCQLFSFWRRPIPIGYEEHTDLITSKHIDNTGLSTTIQPLSLELQFEIANYYARIIFVFLTQEETASGEFLNDLVLPFCLAVLEPKNKSESNGNDTSMFRESAHPMNAFLPIWNKLHLLKNSNCIDDGYISTSRYHCVSHTVSTHSGTSTSAALSGIAVDHSQSGSSKSNISTEFSPINPSLVGPQTFTRPFTDTSTPRRSQNTPETPMTVRCLSLPFLSSLPSIQTDNLPTPLPPDQRILYVPIDPDNDALEPSLHSADGFGHTSLIPFIRTPVIETLHMKEAHSSPLSFAPTHSTLTRSLTHSYSGFHSESAMNRHPSQTVQPSIFSENSDEFTTSKSTISGPSPITLSTMSEPSHVSSAGSNDLGLSASTPSSYSHQQKSQVSTQESSVHSAVGDLPATTNLMWNQSKVQDLPFLQFGPSNVDEIPNIPKDDDKDYSQKRRTYSVPQPPITIPPVLPERTSSFNEQIHVQFMPHPRSQALSPISSIVEDATTTTQPSDESNTLTYSSMSNGSRAHPVTGRTHSSVSDSTMKVSSSATFSSHAGDNLPSVVSSLSIRNAGTHSSHSSLLHDPMASSISGQGPSSLSRLSGIPSYPQLLTLDNHQSASTDIDASSSAITAAPMNSSQDSHTRFPQLESISYLPSFNSDYTVSVLSSHNNLSVPNKRSILTNVRFGRLTGQKGPQVPMSASGSAFNLLAATHVPKSLTRSMSDQVRGVLTDTDDASKETVPPSRFYDRPSIAPSEVPELELGNVPSRWSDADHMIDNLHSNRPHTPSTNRTHSSAAENVDDLEDEYDWKKPVSDRRSSLPIFRNTKTNLDEAQASQTLNLAHTQFLEEDDQNIPLVNRLKGGGPLGDTDSSVSMEDNFSSSAVHIDQVFQVEEKQRSRNNSASAHILKSQPGQVVTRSLTPNPQSDKKVPVSTSLTRTLSRGDAFKSIKTTTTTTSLPSIPTLPNQAIVPFKLNTTTSFTSVTTPRSPVLMAGPHSPSSGLSTQQSSKDSPVSKTTRSPIPFPISAHSFSNPIYSTPPQPTTSGLPPRATPSTNGPPPVDKRSRFFRERSRSIHTSGIEHFNLQSIGEELKMSMSQKSDVTRSERKAMLKPAKPIARTSSSVVTKENALKLKEERDRLMNPLYWQSAFHANIISLAIASCLDEQGHTSFHTIRVSPLKVFEKLTKHLSDTRQTEVLSLVVHTFEVRSGKKAIPLKIFLRLIAPPLRNHLLDGSFDSSSPSSLITLSPAQHESFWKHDRFPFSTGHETIDLKTQQTVRILSFPRFSADPEVFTNIHTQLCFLAHLSYLKPHAPIGVIHDVFTDTDHTLHMVTEPFQCSLKQWRTALFEQEADSVATSLVKAHLNKSQSSPRSKLSMSVSSSPLSQLSHPLEHFCSPQMTAPTEFLLAPSKPLHEYLHTLLQIFLQILSVLQVIRNEDLMVFHLSLDSFSLLPPSSPSPIPFRLSLSPFHLSTARDNIQPTSRSIGIVLFELVTGIPITAFSRHPPTTLNGLYQHRADETRCPSLVALMNRLLGAPHDEPVSFSDVHDDVVSILSHLPEL